MSALPPIVHRWNGTQWTCLRCSACSFDPCDCDCCTTRENGLLVLSTPWIKTWMLVRNGIVVQVPKQASRSEIGQPVTQAMAKSWQMQPGVVMSWVADPPMPMAS
jgi:hypothetical protein